MIEILMVFWYDMLYFFRHVILVGRFKYEHVFMVMFLLFNFVIGCFISCQAKTTNIHSFIALTFIHCTNIHLLIETL